MVYRKIDLNHNEIVKALRAVGATVLSLATIGSGCPDILVGFRGDNFLMEIKSERGKLNQAQVDWHTHWRGSKVRVVRSIEEALIEIGCIRG